MAEAAQVNEDAPAASQAQDSKAAVGDAERNKARSAADRAQRSMEERAAMTIQRAFRRWRRRKRQSSRSAHTSSSTWECLYYACLIRLLGTSQSLHRTARLLEGPTGGWYNLKVMRVLPVFFHTGLHLSGSLEKSTNFPPLKCASTRHGEGDNIYGCPQVSLNFCRMCQHF